jgi:hypothetical protein
VGGALLNYYGTSNGYKLYHYASSCPSSHTRCPTYRGRVTPNHSGSTLYFRLQTYQSGGWRNELYEGFTLNSDGTVTVFFVYSGPGIKGLGNRIRAEFKGDTDHTAKVGPWSYFKVTS